MIRMHGFGGPWPAIENTLIMKECTNVLDCTEAHLK